MVEVGMEKKGSPKLMPLLASTAFISIPFDFELESVIFKIKN